MKNNKNLAKPVIAVALAASFFASPLNTMQVDAAKSSKGYYTNAGDVFLYGGNSYGWNTTDKYWKVVKGCSTCTGGEEAGITHLVKAKRKGYITYDAKKGGFLQMYGGDYWSSAYGSIAAKGGSYTTSYTKNQFVNKVELREYNKKSVSNWKGFFIRKKASSKSATFKIVGYYDLYSGSEYSVYLEGKIDKNGKVTYTGSGGNVPDSVKKEVKKHLKKLWLNREDYPVEKTTEVTTETPAEVTTEVQSTTETSTKTTTEVIQ